MYEEFDTQNNQKQEEDEDSETSSYSYPSYARFTYTGKTKSRLGRSRFLRQTGSKEETKKSDDSMNSGSSELRTTSQPLTSNYQAPKTPGISWLQRDYYLSSNPLTPRASLPNSKNIFSSNSEHNSFPSQSNFLFNLKNDLAQSSSCKRNLPFNNTPLKSEDNHGFKLKEHSRNILENPFSKLDFYNGPKEENKENIKTNTKSVKNNDFDPSWNQLKKICDAAISYPALPSNTAETSDVQNLGVKNNNVKLPSESSRNLSAPFSALEKRDQNKVDDNSSNIPLDLSSAESLTTRNLFSRSLTGGSDNLESTGTSDTLNRQFQDLKEEVEENNETKQKTDTDALFSFLPKFLVPKNKTMMKESPVFDDISNTGTSHSLKTVVEKSNICDIQHQMPFQNPQLPLQALVNVTKSQLTCNANSDIAVPRLHPSEMSHKGNEIDSSSQYDKVVLQKNIQKTSPPILPINFVNKQPISTSPPLADSGNTVQSSSQNQLMFQNDSRKSSLPNVLKPNIPLEPEKFSPPLAQSILGPQSCIDSDVQLGIKQDHFHPQQLASTSNVCSSADKKVDESSKVGESILNLEPPIKDCNIADERISVKPSVNNGMANPLSFGTNTDQLKSTPMSLMNSLNGIPLNRCQPEAKPLESQIVNTYQQLPSNIQIPTNNSLSNVPHPEIRNETRPQMPIESLERNLNQAPAQQVSVLPKSTVTDVRLPENAQPSHLGQKTFLAPQQPSDHRAGNFPHVKPEIPQMVSSKPSFSVMKKPNHFKMSTPRGMPSRSDTELVVNGKSYAILSMLGKGGSSEVYQVLDPRSSKLLAVKCVDLSMVDKTIADGYLNEIDLLSKLQGCASVIRMFDYEYVQECKMLYVVMEKGDTDLSHLIREISKTKKISMSMIIYYWTEMLQAVKDIHDQGIIHSDLKPANFLLVSGRLKLIDFGIASSQGDMTSVVKEVTTGTWNYMSPEAIKNTSASGKGFKITYKSDVWSLGCILYNLVYGKTPFSHITNTWGKLQAIADPNHCIEFPEVGAPEVLARALQSCFHRDPKLRPTVAELLRLPYHSTTADCYLGNIGKQVKALLPTQWWLRVAHLFPEEKSNQEEKHGDNAG